MLILAPMQGLTELMFRRVYERCFPHVFDYAISPFLSLTHGNLADAWKKIDDVRPDDNVGSIPVVPQILGKETDEFIDLANRLGEVGYDEVNWNIGCPMRRVAGKHRGSGILPYPDEVRHVLDTIVPRLKVQLSIKMRLGHVSDEEIFSLIPIINDYPVKNVTIHPRTGKQQYSGSVNLQRFGEAAPLFNAPVIYNGDLRTVADYDSIRQRFPQVQHHMIGRGALLNPLLPAQIKGIAVDEGKARQFAMELIDEIYSSAMHDEAKMRKTKEYWCLLWHNTTLCESQHREILRITTLGELYNAIKRTLQ